MNNLSLMIVMAVLATATLIPSPAQADALADSIRANGQAAMASVTEELRAAIVVAPAAPTYPVSEAIRQQGLTAMRLIALEMEMSVQVSNAVLAGQLQPTRTGTVSVSTLQVSTTEMSESL